MTPSATSTLRHLLVERREAITVLTVNRPQVLNALNEETLLELESATHAFLEDAGQALLIVTGAGEKSFVAGADIKELAPLDPRGAERLSRLGQRVFDRIERGGKPVIAAVNGYAFGGGCELALACHLRIASENAVFGLPEVGLGIIPGYGGTQRLPRLVGMGRALEIILTGRHVKAEEAEKIGLANRVVPLASLMNDAVALGQSIVKNGPIALACALESSLRGFDQTVADGLRLESSLFGTLAASADMHEGMNAFLERRPARFTGQ